jgi:hypothetical protein
VYWKTPAVLVMPFLFGMFIICASILVASGRKAY